MRQIKQRNFFVIAAFLLQLNNMTFSQIKIREFSTSEIKGNTYDNHYFETENGAISVKVKTIGVVVSTKNSTPNINKNELIIQTYIGDDLKEDNSIDYTLPYSNAVFEYAKFLNNRFYIFYTALNKSNSTEQLFCQEISVDSGHPVDDEKLLISVPERLVPNPRYVSPSAAASVPVHNEQGKFELVESQDEKLLMFKYQYKKEKVDAGVFDRYGVVLFDNNLKLLWSKKEFTFPYLSKHLSYADFIVSNEGKGYLLAKRMKDEPVFGNGEKSNPDNFSVSIFIISEEEEIKEANFNLGDRLIKSVAFSDLTNGNIMCAGYYYAPNKMKFTKGVFTTVFSEKNTFEKTNFYDFTQEFVEQYSGISAAKEKSNNKKVESGDFGFEFLKMENVERTEDGGVLIVGGLSIPVAVGSFERYRGTMTAGGSMWNPAGVVPSTGYAYYWSNDMLQQKSSDDMILTKLDENGELMWMQKVPKRTFSGSKMLIANNNIYVLFLDEPVNLELKESDAPKRLELTSGVLVAHRITMDSGERRVFLVSESKTINENKVSYIDRFNLISNLFPLTKEQGFGCQLKVGKGQEKIFQFIIEE